MPISNIIDCRTNYYDVNIMAVIEDSWHDNVCQSATQFPVEDGIDYLGVAKTTIDNIIRYALQKWPEQPLTLFLYDVETDNHADYLTIGTDGDRLILVK